MRDPPLRMRADSETFGRLDFYFTTLAGCTATNKINLETYYIKKFDATGSRGYDNLEGPPGRSRKWWAIHRRRGA